MVSRWFDSCYQVSLVSEGTFHSTSIGITTGRQRVDAMALDGHLEPTSEVQLGLAKHSLIWANCNWEGFIEMGSNLKMCIP